MITKLDQTTADVPQYKVVARATLESNTDSCQFKFETDKDDILFQYMIKKFQNKVLDYTQDTLNEFNNTPLVKLIHKYHDENNLDNFKIDLLANINQKIKANKLHPFLTKLTTDGCALDIQLFDKNNHQNVAVKFNLFSYGKKATSYENLTKHTALLFSYNESHAYNQTLQPYYLQLRALIE